MSEKISLDMLTTDSVSIVKQKYTVVDGIEYPIGKQWRRAYVNSDRGRNQIQNDVEEPYKTVIMTMWGSEPTVIESNPIE
jgi:hypothetical protein